MSWRVGRSSGLSPPWGVGRRRPSPAAGQLARKTSFTILTNPIKYVLLLEFVSVLAKHALDPDVVGFVWMTKLDFICHHHH